MNAEFGPLHLADEAVELRPAYDRVLCTYTLDLLRDGQLIGTLDEGYDTIDKVVDNVGDFLADAAVRDLTEREVFELTGALWSVRGGTGLEVFLRQARERGLIPQRENTSLEFDIDTLGGPVRLDNVSVELRPVYDRRLRTFAVQLWKDGEPAGIHGLTDAFTCADEPLEAIDAFLAERGVRAVTGEEAAFLYAGLVRAKGGPDWSMLLMDITGGQLL